MRITTIIASCLALSLLSGSLVLADDHAAGDPEAEAVQAAVKAQTTCPVMGGKINKNLYVDVDGQRVYVCCKGCIGVVKKNPEKYIKKLEEQGVTLERPVVAQTTCPVMGGKINKNLYVDVDGQRVYVCCKGCIGAVKKNPEKYIKKLEEQGVTLETVHSGALHGKKVCPITKDCPAEKCHVKQDDGEKEAEKEKTEQDAGDE